jgi:DnaJ-class molecular chaperone
MALKIEPLEVRIVTCEACDGEGWVDVSTSLSGDSDVQRRCRVCHGSGAELVEVVPVTLEELEEAHGGVGQ